MAISKSLQHKVKTAVHMANLVLSVVLLLVYTLWAEHTRHLMLLELAILFVCSMSGLVLHLLGWAKGFLTNLLLITIPIWIWIHGIVRYSVVWPYGILTGAIIITLSYIVADTHRWKFVLMLVLLMFNGGMGIIQAYNVYSWESWSASDIRVVDIVVLINLWIVFSLSLYWLYRKYTFHKNIAELYEDLIKYLLKYDVISWNRVVKNYEEVIKNLPVDEMMYMKFMQDKLQNDMLDAYERAIFRNLLEYRARRTLHDLAGPLMYLLWHMEQNMDLKSNEAVEVLRKMRNLLQKYKELDKHTINAEKKGRFNLCNALKQTIDIAQYLLARAGLRATLSYTHECKNVEINGSNFLFMQVMLNILINASEQYVVSDGMVDIKHGRIIIKLACLGDYLCIKVVNPVPANSKARNPDNRRRAGTGIPLMQFIITKYFGGSINFASVRRRYITNIHLPYSKS